LDATERAPHLADALGDAVAALLARGWVLGIPGRCTVHLTAQGAAGLCWALGGLEPTGRDRD
jgi:hypothetical protein